MGPLSLAALGFCVATGHLRSDRSPGGRRDRRPSGRADCGSVVAGMPKSRRRRCRSGRVGTSQRADEEVWAVEPVRGATCPFAAAWAQVPDATPPPVCGLAFRRRTSSLHLACLAFAMHCRSVGVFVWWAASGTRKGARSSVDRGRTRDAGGAVAHEKGARFSNEASKKENKKKREKDAQKIEGKRKAKTSKEGSKTGNKRKTKAGSGLWLQFRRRWLV